MHRLSVHMTRLTLRTLSACRREVQSLSAHDRWALYEAYKRQLRACGVSEEEYEHRVMKALTLLEL